LASSHSGLYSDISPNILLIIVILSIIFFISGLLHLLVHLLLRPASRDSDDSDNMTVLIGSYKESFSAVCLCEFAVSSQMPRSLAAVVLSSSSWSPNERAQDRSFPTGATLQAARWLSTQKRNLPMTLRRSRGRRPQGGGGRLEAEAMEVVPIKLDKFKYVDTNNAVVGNEDDTDNSTLNERRCFSMGSFEYIMDEASILHVAIKPLARKPDTMKHRHLDAMSECDCHS
ncbi:hypothetical protein Taro_035492, partial [Colocasia esculenta]|nr:hypothetical protein [Colocasia esculenta]